MGLNYPFVPECKTTYSYRISINQSLTSLTIIHNVLCLTVHLLGKNYFVISNVNDGIADFYGWHVNGNSKVR